MRRRGAVRFLVAILAVGALAYTMPWSDWRERARLYVAGKKSTEERISEFGDAARARMVPFFDAANVPYPPPSLTLVALKASRTLSVYAGIATGKGPLITTYPILGMSGVKGPKLREGDRQVPEGFYRVEGLNPNSNFHVSLRLNYPNDFDREKAAADGRSEPGSDIYIHGRTASVGCLAMGDSVIEELFTLADDVGLDSIQVIIAPDAECVPRKDADGAPEWIPELYGRIRAALDVLRPL